MNEEENRNDAESMLSAAMLSAARSYLFATISEL
jgi:hypothetical protein